MGIRLRSSAGAASRARRGSWYRRNSRAPHTSSIRKSRVRSRPFAEQEGLQQLELLRRERHELAADPRPRAGRRPARRARRSRTVGARLTRSTIPSPAGGPERGRRAPASRRASSVVVGAPSSRPGHLVGLGVLRRHDDDRTSDSARIARQTSRPESSGQHQIEDDERRAIRAEPLERPSGHRAATTTSKPSRSRPYRIAVGQRLLVLHDEDRAVTSGPPLTPVSIPRARVRELTELAGEQERRPVRAMSTA